MTNKIPSWVEFQEKYIGKTRDDILQKLFENLNWTKTMWKALGSDIKTQLHLLRTFCKELDIDLSDINVEKEFHRAVASSDKRKNEEIAHSVYTKQKVDIHELPGLYYSLYEPIGQLDLSRLTSKFGKGVNSIGNNLNLLREYKNGYYIELFTGFNNHVRNSIEHVNYKYLDDLDSIEFINEFNNKKTVVTWSYMQFAEACRQLIILEFAVHFLTAEHGHLSLLKQINPKIDTKDLILFK